MLCQNCHKNLASVRYAEVVGGKVTNLHLCPECLAAHQKAAGAGFQLSGPVTAARPDSSLWGDRGGLRVPRRCKSCGARLVRVLDAAQVGCAECYSAFAKTLAPILLEVHGSARHAGKVPRVDDRKTALRADLQTKRVLLRNAVAKESYEDAAMLRDEIRHLETQLQTVESVRE